MRDQVGCKRIGHSCQSAVTQSEDKRKSKGQWKPNWHTPFVKLRGERKKERERNFGRFVRKENEKKKKRERERKERKGERGKKERKRKERREWLNSTQATTKGGRSDIRSAAAASFERNGFSLILAYVKV